MILNSIRWRIQIWHTVLLTIIVTSLLFAFHRHQREIIYQELDSELRTPIAGLLPLLSPHSRPPHFRPHRPGAKPVNRLPSGFTRQPNKGRPKPQRAIANASHIKTLLTESGFYAIGWSNKAEPTLRIPEDTTIDPPRPNKIQNKFQMRTRGHFREATHTTPRGHQIVIGTNTNEIEAGLRNLFWKLLGIGAGIVVAGVTVGFFLTGRALHPIKTISNTAQEIAAGNFSKRIKSEDTETELGHLVQLLNTTFAKLESSYQQQVRFTAHASHEMRTPISIILAKSQFALSRQRSPEKYIETIQTCADTAQHMRGIIESLLTLSQMDSGNFDIAKGPGDLAELLDQCLEMLTPLASEKDIVLNAQFKSTEFIFDTQRLRQVIINILGNAIKYCDPEDQVTLSLNKNESGVEIAVSDTGPGIPEQELPHLFERFYRVDKARTHGSSTEQSSGLGLAIARSIVQAHEGTIEVSSTVGKGSTFTISLPFAVNSQ